MRTQFQAHPARYLSLSIGVLAAGVAVVPDQQIKLVVLLLAASVAVAYWCLLSASHWLFAFFLCALLTPPLPVPGLATAVHVAPVVVLLGALSGGVRMLEWKRPPLALAAAFIAFLGMLGVSACIGALYSGVDVGLGSLARVGLFGIGVYVFFYASAGPGERGAGSMNVAAFLFLAAIATAIFGCADFYFHFPAPAGFGEQFVWLDEGVYRRAQGLFYEASTFGNLCAFFLVMIAVAVSHGTKDLPLRLPILVGGGIVLGAALILSYSRGSVVNLVAACLALAILRGASAWRMVAVAVVTALLTALAVQSIWPSFSASYWTRISDSFRYFWYSPDGVLSHRLSNWRPLIDFALRQPWKCLLGIGYKTLPSVGIAGTPIIADNTYLGLLIETGLVGLALFFILNYCILRAALRAARGKAGKGVFFGEWIFCFWVGQTIQMLSGDLITYWRVLPVYFWVLGTAIRETEAM